MEFQELADLASEMSSPTDGVPVKTRKYLLKTYPSCFLGSEAVAWLAKQKECSKPAALALGNQLFKAGLIRHAVDPSKPLLDGNFFYRFSPKVKKKKGNLATQQIPTSVKGIARMMSDRRAGVDVRTRKYRLKSYKDCFVASEAVDWMLKNLAFRTRGEGVEMGQKLVDEGHIEHVVEVQPYRDAFLFFRFTQSMQAPGTPSRDDEDDMANAVDASDFEKLTLLGEGGYGKVWLVRKNTTGKVYAMKVLEKVKIKSQKALEHTITEKQVLINNSPFLLHLHFSFQTPSKLYMVTDYLPGGDMFFHLSKKNGAGFSPKVARFFTAELVLALEHLHQCGVIYRDLKLENVLLDQQGHICLADFGLSKVLDSSDSTQTFCGSQGYLAPEILRGETYTYNVDWFSLGVIMFEMMSGTNPFLGVDFHETCRNILHKNITFPSQYFNSKAADLLARFRGSNFLQLLSRDVTDRFQSAHDIKLHPWFKPIDWSKLELKKIRPPFNISVVSKESTENFDEFFTKMEITYEENDSASDSDAGGRSNPNLFGDFNYVSPDL